MKGSTTAKVNVDSQGVILKGYDAVAYFKQGTPVEGNPEIKSSYQGGGLNWYRNLDRNWELTPFLSGAKIRQPSLFVAGEFDPVVTIYQQAFDSLEETMPGLTKKVLVPGAGHWIQQERPNEVNDLLIEFLASL